MNDDHHPVAEAQSQDSFNNAQAHKEAECSFLSYESENALYALGFSNNRNQNLKVALGTYMESDNNGIKILEVPDNKSSINFVTQIEHQYPPTKLKFHPDPVRLLERRCLRSAGCHF